MQIVRSSEELTRARSSIDGSLALVPTMGALHPGHLALIDEAKRHADCVAVTIFVNPMQFGANDDFSRYPRQEQADVRLLDQHGCDLLWIPQADDIYPQGFATTVSVAGVTDRWEGEARPGHFAGVATVVAKLLLKVEPTVALFGEKDFQQLAVIRRMVTDLGFGVEIVAVPTVREEDGLALSSRNAYLSQADRSRSTALYRALCNARRSINAGQPVSAALGEARDALIVAGFSSVDYFVLVDSDTLAPLERAKPGARLVAAATIGSTRLIDNLEI